MTPFVSAADFQDKYLSCTLVEDRGKVVSEREAKGRNEFNIDIIIKQKIAIYKNEIFEYRETDDKGIDSYTNGILFNMNVLFFNPLDNTIEVKGLGLEVYECNSRKKSLFDYGREIKAIF